MANWEGGHDIVDLRIRQCWIHNLARVDKQRNQLGQCELHKLATWSWWIGKINLANNQIGNNNVDLAIWQSSVDK